MVNANFCSVCGTHLEPGVHFCPKCGNNLEQKNTSQSKLKELTPSSPKSGGITLLLCLFLGFLGAHRFYVKKIWTGLLMLITAGGFGIWLFVDLILIVTNQFEDKQGRRVELTKRPSTVRTALLLIGVIVAWFLLFVGAVVAIVFYITSGLIYSIDHQLQALQAGDIKKAYSYTSKDFQKVTSLSTFEKFVAQYPSLKNNESAFFNERAFENNLGTVKGTLTAKDGAKTPIEYKLIWEDGTWKILGIRVIYTGAGIKVKDNNNQSKAAPIVQKIFENKASKYTIRYPNNWTYKANKKGTVIMRGPVGTSNYNTIISIQTVLAGKYTNSNDLTKDIKEQLGKLTTDVKILSEGEAELATNPKQFSGEYFLVTYTYKNEAFKQMHFIIAREDKKAFYIWAYTAPIEQFDVNLPIAKAMYESWTIE